MAFGWRLLRIRGRSMMPLLDDGDFALARRLRAGEEVAVGEIVEIDHPDIGPMVKSVAAVRPHGVRVRGLAAMSIDGDQLGPIARAWIGARLVWRISPRGLSRIAARRLA